MKSLILSLALILSAFIAPAASYSVVELVPPVSGQLTNTSTFYQTNANGLIFTNTSVTITPILTVVTNGQLGVVGRIAISPGDTIGIVASYKGASASSPTKGWLNAERTVPGCSAATTASGRWRLSSIAAVCSNWLSAALAAR